MDFACEKQTELSQQGLETGARVLAQAFFLDPSFCAVQPSPVMRRKALTTVYSACLRHAARRGAVIWNSQAAAGWVPLSTLAAGLGELLRMGYGTIPFRFGLAATYRLHAHGSWCDRQLMKYISEPTAYVYFVGVDPEFAGRGIGSKLLERTLESAAEDYPCCALRTEQPRNVRFYEKLGFQCVEHTVVPLTGVPVWFFVRPLRR